jgi:hypothetical protein
VGNGLGVCGGNRDEREQVADGQQQQQQQQQQPTVHDAAAS